MSAPERHPPAAVDSVQAAYSLELESPGSAETMVESYASLPAVVARAAQLIQAGYSIGIWSRASVEGDWHGA
jgi:hypothetical protein